MRRRSLNWVEYSDPSIVSRPAKKGSFVFCDSKPTKAGKKTTYYSKSQRLKKGPQIQK